MPLVDVGDVVRYGLYALTLALGIALVLWMLRSRQAAEEQARTLQRARAKSRQDERPTRVKAVRGIQVNVSMSEALAGVRLPVHWQPDPPVEVRSPFTLTTSQETAEEMAETLTTELARIGYRITPTGAASAKAVRDDSTLSIEVDADGDGSFVSSRIKFGDVRG